MLSSPSPSSLQEDIKVVKEQNVNSQLIKSANAEKVKAARESVDFHKLSRKGTVAFEHGAENSTQI